MDYPLEIEARLSALHARTPVRAHLDMLYGDVRVGHESYVDLYSRCLEHTGTALTPYTVFHRFQTRHDLVRYFLATLDIPGGRVECGAYRGATALLLCNVWRSRDSGYMGDGFYLIDSFSGTSESTPHDLIAVRDARGDTRMAPFFPPRKTDVTSEMVRGFFTGFPDARVCEGWIPQVFEQLPEQPWAFVHLDLTLYEATLAALRYFYPRLASRGVLVCDGSPFCPGAQKAMEDFCRETDIAYATLGHRETVLIKN
ncbi:MAG TPA: TylF/MycF/NovP-related O-methyltransferase [Burkholderiales bacterium]|nr:TylF/MycF/NovP-related O-methyltransferase [Burkholderiales bacterium]